MYAVLDIGNAVAMDRINSTLQTGARMVKSNPSTPKGVLGARIFICNQHEITSFSTNEGAYLIVSGNAVNGDFVRKLQSRVNTAGSVTSKQIGGDEASSLLMVSRTIR
ncbi:MAG: hypothetical protein OEZ58_02705 [Gammaproteobacteria bacterium]|nr:hypothetical protein [Gammaproteobacteria bacterium]MDH5727873.1 hypothetical protein [Gammaproteobacteria bacterium]